MPQVESELRSVRIVTEDLNRFWVAFDAPGSLALNLERLYLTPGSPGLRDFTNLRLENAEALTTAVTQHKRYYNSIRTTMLRAPEQASAIQSVFKRLTALLPSAVLPDTYLLVGRLDTGGTISKAGLLIGTELFCHSPAADVDALTPWQRAAVRPLTHLPRIVAHELTHYQQLHHTRITSIEALPHVLALTIIEGAAEFVGELLSGSTVNPHLTAYGLAHELELWQEFRAQMHGKDHSRWLYQGKTVDDRPADLGYFIGYRIVRSYYTQARDKTTALQEILSITDYDTFLERSSYNPTNQEDR